MKPGPPWDEERARLDAERLRPGERVELLERIDASLSARRPTRWVPRLAAVAAVIAIVAVLGWVWRRPRPETVVRGPTLAPAVDGAPERRTVAPDEARVAACAPDPTEASVELPSFCGERTLSVGADRWDLTPGTRITRSGPAMVTVEAGRVRFRIAHREASHFRVGVSHGVVEVVGTAFTVVQRDGEGEVAVEEGVVAFHWDGGRTEVLRVDDRLEWPAPSPPVARPPAVERAPPDVDVEAVTDRLLQLRSQRRLDEAIALLRDALRRRGLTRLQRERLSYELGTLIEQTGGDACEHWRAHQARFGSARAEVARRVASCPRVPQ